MSFMADLIRQKQNYKWRKKNPHNKTKIQYATRLDLIQVGRYSYGDLYVINEGTDHKLIVGDFCSIAGNVTFIVQGDHPIDRISTFPFHRMCLSDGMVDAVSNGDIVIDDDVWIGHGATILSGVHIGQGAVIAAGAVVTKNVDPYAIVGGIPSRTISYRFNSEQVKELLKIDFKRITYDTVKQYIDSFERKISDIEDWDWLPKK